MALDLGSKWFETLGSSIYLIAIILKNEIQEKIINFILDFF